MPPAADEPTQASVNPLETVVVARSRDLGDGFQVRRALPTVERRMVGPFVFLDQMGAVELAPGKGLDVRPHPHIGLATVTYLFDGEILHRDSLGTVQSIRPGEVNWMTAGRGIVHSERTAPDVRARGHRLFGLQIWVALPKDREDVDPAFAHHGANELPTVEDGSVRATIILGSAFGKSSAVRTLSDMVYVDLALKPGATAAIGAWHEERAVYVVHGPLAVVGQDGRYDQGQLLVLRPGAEVVLSAPGPQAARCVLVGGEPMDGPRHVWWNFVSHSKDRIEAAKADWKAGRFAPVPGETEFIPLPETPPPKVDYP